MHRPNQAAFQAVAHGTFQVGMTAISGGKFWSGFAAGALSSIASSAWGGGTSQTEGFSAENNWAYGAKTIHHAGLGAGTGTAGMIAFGTVAGGAGAALTGGNFWQGAVTGLVVSGLNHGFHDNEIDPPGKKGQVQKSPSTSEKILAAGGFYNDFMHEHEFYRTTKNVLKPIYKSNGAARSARAANFATASKSLKVFGTVGGAVSTGMSYNKIITGQSSTIDYIDAGVGTAGLGAAAASSAGYAVPYVGQIAAIYGAIRFSYDMEASYGPSKWYGSDNNSWFK